MAALTRRSLFLAAGAAMGAGFLASCSGVGSIAGGGGGGGSGSTTLRYAFWGNDIRLENYQKAFDAMTEENADLALNLEFAGYDAFRERMTTQMAAGNVADIFWIPSPMVMTYYASGVYRSLSDVTTLDLSDYSEQDITDFELAGEHNTMPFGSYVPVVRFNQTFADEDGVEIPETWSWDDLATFAKDYSAEGRYAVAYAAESEFPLEGWLRQHGEEMWTEDGQMGFSQDGLAEWIDWWEKLRKAGATPSIGEQNGIAPSWEDVGDKTLMWFANSNHIIDDSTVYPDYAFSQRHLPVAEQATAGHQFLYFPRMAIYQDIDDERAELAGRVVSYCTSNVDMPKTTGLTMGAPVNPRVAEEYREFASDIELAMLDLVNEDRNADRRPRFDAPPGTNNWRATLSRYLEEITLGDTSVADGAASTIEEIQNGIDRADV